MHPLIKIHSQLYFSEGLYNYKYFVYVTMMFINGKYIVVLGVKLPNFVLYIITH